MKNITKLLLFLIPLAAHASQAQTWLPPVPPSVDNWRDWKHIPDSAFFEVPASKLATAEAWLANSSYLAQDENGVKYFDRANFTCAAPSQAYLIRAAYVNGGTGSFVLSWVGSALVVSHVALGGDGPVQKSALVACLSKEPSAIYSSISGAL